MAWDRTLILECCAISAAAAWNFYLLARFVNHRSHLASLQHALQDTQAALDHECVKRKADRVGRIRAEQELRSIKVQLQRLQLQLQLQPQSNSQIVTAVADASGACPEDGRHDCHGEGLEATKRPSLEEEKWGASQRKIDEEEEQRNQQQQRLPEEEVKDQGARRRHRGQQQQQHGGFAGVVKGSALEHQSGSVVSGDGLEAKWAATAATAALAAAGSAMPAFPFRPIGHLQSVFTERNGTPRQPQLVPAARSRLVLSPNVPAACLEGLEQYSHCWVLYVFHANTDLAKYLAPERSGLKAKIHVPRLNGGRMGVLATRSPHRPSPIGLSTAEVIRVEGNSVVLGGADIVDGSPVLDIKPYVPFCDCLPHARAPEWVQAEAEDEPLAVRHVMIGEAARAAVIRAWQIRKTHSMYGTVEQYLELVRQVLSRDIRSVHQRLRIRPTTTAAPPAAASSGAGVKGRTVVGRTGGGNGQDGEGRGAGEYHLVLENIYVSYDISPHGVVQLVDAWVDSITVR